MVGRPGREALRVGPRSHWAAVARDTRPSAKARMEAAMKEREAKFLVTSRSVPVDLGARPEVFGFKVGPVRVVEQSDVYFDTADLKLHVAGEALRIRTRGGSRLFTFKGVPSGGDFMVRE